MKRAAYLLLLLTLPLLSGCSVTATWDREGFSVGGAGLIPLPQTYKNALGRVLKLHPPEGE